MKKLATWVTCRGEAHSNPWIDNCGVCMPYWGKYPVCDLEHMLTETGYCKKCKKFYELNRKDA